MTTLYEGYLKNRLPKDAPPPGEKIRFDEIMTHLGCGESFKQAACDIREGAPTRNNEIDLRERIGYLHDWLNFAQSDSTLARKRWSYLAAEGQPRDEFTLKLWKQASVAEKEDGLAVGFRKFVADKWCDWPYYERHFFGWFLSRFDLVSARAVYTTARVSQGLDFLLAAIAAMVCVLLGPGMFNFQTGFAALGAVVVLVGTAGWLWARDKKRGLPFYAFANSLVPRLGAAVGIGYLFLASAQHLVIILAGLKQSPWFFWSASAALLLGAFLYIAFHISRRVHPRLEKKALLRRSGSVLALAVTYSLVELLVAGPVLFSDAFVCGISESETCTPLREIGRLILCAAIALNLGVILQLAWDEKPLTEPL